MSSLTTMMTWRSSSLKLTVTKTGSSCKEPSVYIGASDVIETGDMDTIDTSTSELPSTEFAPPKYASERF